MKFGLGFRWEGPCGVGVGPDVELDRELVDGIAPGGRLCRLFVDDDADPGFEVEVFDMDKEGRWLVAGGGEGDLTGASRDELAG